jgi:hypothetical protein
MLQGAVVEQGLVVPLVHQHLGLALVGRALLLAPLVLMREALRLLLDIDTAGLAEPQTQTTPLLLLE